MTNISPHDGAAGCAGFDPECRFSQREGRATTLPHYTLITSRVERPDDRVATAESVWVSVCAHTADCVHMCTCWLKAFAVISPQQLQFKPHVYQDSSFVWVQKAAGRWLTQLPQRR